MYKNKTLMRFFYGKQFYILSKYIDNKLNILNKNENELLNINNENKVVSLIKHI